MAFSCEGVPRSASGKYTLSLRLVFDILAGAAALGALTGIGYYLLCIVSARSFLGDRGLNRRLHVPGATILKPLRGVDPGIYESFRSHCLQDHPNFELVFGVSDAQDAAIPLVRKLQSEFPGLRIELVVADTLLGSNGKVSTLAQMLPIATQEYLIVNDSDITVEPDYLRRVIAPFTNPDVGMVTCLYRGIAERTLGSRIESVGISTDFAAGVLAARIVQGVKFGLGSTMAFRRDDLEQIGGFEAVVDYLADDYEIGARISKLGREVVLSDVVVETHLPAYSFGEFFRHQLRWARAIRDSRKFDYLGMGLTFGLPWALCAVLFASGAEWSWWLLGVVLLSRFAMAVQVGRGVLHDRQLARDWWLVPIRDLIALLVWVASFAGHTVKWRGQEFALKHGKLVRP